MQAPPNEAPPPFKAMRSVDETVRCAAQGDAAAFAELIGRFERTALAVAFSVLGDGDLAADAVQESFLRAWQRLGDLRESERFGPWLCGIVRNQARDTQRRHCREMRVRATMPVAVYARRDDDPANGILGREMEGRLMAALDQLDELSRAAILLRYYEGLSTKQIAGLLGCAPTAIDMRLTRARHALRRELAGDGPDGTDTILR
jgi:RNA polymerase sigma-70 factor, ECF subfamily